MVLLAEPIEGTLNDVKSGGGGGRVIYLSPQGTPLKHKRVMEFAKETSLTLLCGRYAGVDERLLSRRVDEELSIGDFVLSGGELAAMVVCDGVLRKLPGALGHADSAVEESYSTALAGRPEYPHYTRPAEYRGWMVPEVLLSGHHERIREWRLEESRRRAEERGG